MSTEKNRKFISQQFEQMHNYLNYLSEHPDEKTPFTEALVRKLHSDICSVRALSEHSGWGVKCKVLKFNKSTDEIPYEVIETKLADDEALAFVGNVITNAGAEQMLKLICGTPESTPYDNANAKIFVGTDSTPENPSQTGVIATSVNRAFAPMDSGFPKVTGRTAVFRATFNDGSANFAWEEMSLTNGSGSSIALNRKQKSMGTKNGGVWAVQLEVSIVEI